jgi:hypothetical protein
MMMMMIMMTTAVLSYFNSSIIVFASLDASSVTTTTTIISSTINSNTATTIATARQRLLQEQEDDGSSSSSSSSSQFIYSNLKPCSLSSYELSKLDADVNVEPCIVHEVLPTFLTSVSTSINYNTTSTIPIVQVTPTNCNNHRDGTVTAVRLINQDNNGKGVSIGFNGMVDEEESTTLDEDKNDQQHYVQFHLVSVIAGNPTALSETEYDERHTQILQSLITSLGGVLGGVPYIVGTCSFASEIEKDVANENQAILMAQVGPPGFYTSSSNNNTNSYVFGFHINSDEYPLPNVQSLTFLTDKGGSTSRGSVPVRVIYREKSEFFYSTCRSAIDTLRGSGFTNIQEFLYDHADDHDDDGVINQVDEEFLIDLADRACRPPTTTAAQAPGADGRFHPAFFLCTLTEQDVLIKRWLETGCRPLSTWVTAATWSWADENPQLVPYMEGGAQWHPAFTYNDKYFDSGNDLLKYNEGIFGYAGDYDQVVSYGKDTDLRCSALLL